MLTGVKDVDLKILQELRDDEISKVCSANKYVAKLCNDETFWLNRLLKNYDVETIKEMKQDLTYKALYRYIFFDRERGLDQAIKSDNLTLFKLINPVDFSQFIIYEKIGANAAINILTYLLLNTGPDDRVEIKSLVLDSLNDNVFKWLHKMEEISYINYFIVLINHHGDFEKVYNKFKKFEKYITFRDHYIFEIMETLGLSLDNDNLKEREKLYNLFQKYNTSKDEGIKFLKGGLEYSQASQETRDKLLKYVLK